MARQAFIVRMNTSGGDVADKGRELGLLLVGWSSARGLDDSGLDYDEFRELVHQEYYGDDDNYRRSGRSAGVLWNFMREMRDGDLIVVPRPGTFWVGQVAGDAFESDEGDETDTVHRRPVTWLTPRSIPRRRARSALVSRMKSRGTVTNASDLIEDIELALESAGDVAQLSGAAVMREKLVAATHHELLSGYFDERRFEELVRDVLEALGAAEARIVPRQHDVGADIIAQFPIGGLTLVPVHVQVKYWRPEQGLAGPRPIKQLLASMDDVEIGIVVTTTEFDDEARAYAESQAEATGKEILLYGGLEFSQLIIDHGVRGLVA